MSNVKRKLNIRIMLQIAILIAFATFFLILVINDSAKYYVHPRIIPYLIFSAITFIIIALCLSKKLYNTDFSSGRLGVYLIFIVPIILFIVIPSSESKLSDSSIIDANSKYSSKLQGDTNSIKNNRASLANNDNRIVINDGNYSKWINEMYSKTDKYIGKRICISGFVHKEKSFMANQFVIARCLMTCCTADTTTLGVLCSYNHQNGIDEGAWAEVEGILTKMNCNGEIVPVIHIESVKAIPKPENVYIYN